MSYVIINGKKSSLVKGLLIQSLPIISKPLLRSKIEEIDGRDGDIITKLGYAAYDKTVKIGLFGDYDVDEVIRFFNQSGKVIFSNEPDKFYKFDILNQIDFEKLLRFKQADVTFHCQPFKYSAVDDSLTFNTTGLNQIKIFNRGNVESRPRISFTASGNVAIYLSLNGTQILVFTAANQTIVIDGEKMNAYIGTSLANRSVSGDYNKLRLLPGENTISWTNAYEGSLTQITVENFARWI